MVRYSKRVKRLLYKYPKEFVRDYSRHEKLTADNILPCDYENNEEYGGEDVQDSDE